MTNPPPALAPVQFAYDALAPADAAAVRRATDRLRSALAATARLVVAIGLHLRRVRRRLKPYRGAWEAYVRTEVPWSRGQAYRLMRAARAFRAVREVDNFQATALYVLTWPNAPAGAARAALAMAREGHRIDAATARRLVADHRPAPPGADGPPPPPVPPKAGAGAPPPEPDGARWWDLVAECERRFTTLHVSWDEDGDGVGVTAYPREEGGSIARFHRNDLPAALAAILGLEPKAKRCPTCGERKPLAQFSRNAAEDDGLSRYCRACARKFREERKAKKGARAKRPRRRPEV